MHIIQLKREIFQNWATCKVECVATCAKYFGEEFEYMFVQELQVEVVERTTVNGVNYLCLKNPEKYKKNLKRFHDVLIDNGNSNFQDAIVWLKNGNISIIEAYSKKLEWDEAYEDEDCDFRHHFVAHGIEEGKIVYTDPFYNVSGKIDILKLKEGYYNHLVVRHQDCDKEPVAEVLRELCETKRYFDCAYDALVVYKHSFIKMTAADCNRIVVESTRPFSEMIMFMSLTVRKLFIELGKSEKEAEEYASDMVRCAYNVRFLSYKINKCIDNKTLFRYNDYVNKILDVIRNLRDIFFRIEYGLVQK